MSSAIVPKEQQTAFQRWEMNSFGDARPNARQAEANKPKITIEELAQIREEARARGHAEGLAEGRARGHAEGLEQGLAQGRAQAATEAANLAKIAAALNGEAQRADELIAQDVLALALDLSRAMLKSALSVRPEVVLPIVGEAIRYLPSLQQPALLFLNPADAAIVRQHMADELDKAGWRVVEDAHVARGGCRIETATNQIDAGIDTRWARLTETLGQHSDWME